MLSTGPVPTHYLTDHAQVRMEIPTAEHSLPTHHRCSDRHSPCAWTAHKGAQLLILSTFATTRSWLFHSEAYLLTQTVPDQWHHAQAMTKKKALIYIWCTLTQDIKICGPGAYTACNLGKHRATQLLDISLLWQSFLHRSSWLTVIKLPPNR